MKKLVINLLLITGIIICVCLELILSYIAGENIIAQVTISFTGGLVIALIVYTLISDKEPQSDIEKEVKNYNLNEFLSADYKDEYKAEEVRKLVQDKTNYNYKQILYLIRGQAKEGQHETVIEYKRNLFNYEPCMKQPLEELGYTVKDYGDKVIISWY